MKRWLSSSLAVRSLAISLVLALASSSALAQEAAKPARAKPKGRLPAHYAKIVDPKQREAIYDLQSQFASKKETLQEQLAAIEAEEMAAIEAVLTPEQKEQLASLQKEAKAIKDKKAAEKAAEKKTAPGKAPSDKPADKPAEKPAAKKAA